MTVVDTDFTLRLQLESARRIRFEQTGDIMATNVQQAIEQAYAQAVAIAQPPETSISSVSSPYTVKTTDRVLLVDTAGGAVTINLLPAASMPFDLEIKDDTGHAAANNITVTPNGSETVDGLAPYVMDSNFSNTVLGTQVGGYYVKA